MYLAFLLWLVSATLAFLPAQDVALVHSVSFAPYDELWTRDESPYVCGEARAVGFPGDWTIDIVLRYPDAICREEDVPAFVAHEVGHALGLVQYGDFGERFAEAYACEQLPEACR